MPRRDAKPAQSRTLQEIDGTASLPVKIVRGALVCVVPSRRAMQPSFHDADNATAVRAATDVDTDVRPIPASAGCVAGIAFWLTGMASQALGNAMLNHSKTCGSVPT